MLAIPLVAALLMGTPQQADAPQPYRPQWTPEQQEQIKQKQEQFRKQHEPVRQRAIHINDLAGNIHSEADARAYVDAVAEELTGHRHMSWTTRSIRHRVAHAEFEAATDASRKIPEQRIVDIWNEYVREIDAPEEATVSLAELHNLRDAMYSSGESMWKNEMTQSLWSMPNIYAIDADGKVASGLRAVEALKVIRDMHEMFGLVASARARVQKGVLESDLRKQPREAPQFSRTIFTTPELHAIKNDNPIRPAAYHYQEHHGERAYQQLLKRLFAELFPAD